MNPELPGNGGSEGCVAHSDCGDFGDSYVCGAAGTCVDAYTRNCVQHVGPLGEDNVVIVGSIMPTVGDFTSIGLPIQQAQELALVEFNNAGGLPGGRRLVMLECDSSGSRDQGIEVADHLIDKIGVPVIFGPAFSSIFIDVTTQRAAPRGVMTISPSATSPTISGIEDGNLGWRTAASDTFQGGAIGDLIKDRGFTKVIAFGKDDAYGSGLLDRVNGKVLDTLTADDYFSLTFPDPGSNPNPDFPGVVTTALAQQPDAEVAILLGTTEVADLLDLIETYVKDSSTTAQSNMRYILADGGKADETLALATEDESLLARIEGTEADHQNGSLYAAFNLRFRQRFGAAAGIYNANAYDAVYMIAYAMSSLAPEDPVTGTAVADAMSKLVGGGREVEVGPSNINLARNALAAGETIDFEGASGPLDFDPSTGEAGANVARWIIEKRENGEFRFIGQGRYTVDQSGDGTWSEID